MTEATELSLRCRAAPVVIFAHLPPPDHGQSRMVRAMLSALEGKVPVIHVDARFSDGINDVGSHRLGKGLRIFRFLGAAVRARWQGGARTLYYVPGPVKWSAVVRDWVILGVLRPFFPHLILHWHAIGQGEWSAGSERVGLPGPEWLDRLGRRISSMILSSPDLSIAVSSGSAADGRCLGSWRSRVLPNGVEDPCPGRQAQIIGERCDRLKLSVSGSGTFRVLYFSRGTLEKGIMDALNALERVVDEKQDLVLSATFAGGVDPSIETEFLKKKDELERKGLKIEALGFVDGAKKEQCFLEHDLLFSTSRWESFGLTVVEAMAWGMPVVVAASDGVMGVMSDDYRYLAPVGEVIELANSLQSCIDDLQSGRASDLSSQLRMRYEEEFAIDSFERAAVKLFVEELSNHQY